MGGGPLKTSSFTGVAVTVPESAVICPFGSTASALTRAFSLACTGAGALGVTSFAAPLSAVAGGGLISLLRRGCWGASGAGLASASGGFGAETSSCAPLVPAWGGAVVLAVVSDCKTPQPARESENAAMRRALESAARVGRGLGRDLPAGGDSRRPNERSPGTGSPG